MPDTPLKEIREAIYSLNEIFELHERKELLLSIVQSGVLSEAHRVLCDLADDYPDFE